MSPNPLPESEDYRVHVTARYRPGMILDSLDSVWFTCWHGTFVRERYKLATGCEMKRS
jgi:hypothetical protein